MCDAKKFFCIRGYMKSGTNWVGRMLHAQAGVACLGEFHWETFFEALQGNVQRIAPKRRAMLHNQVRPELEAMVRRCLSAMAPPGTRMIGDRTPTTLAPIVLPDSPHIVVMRDFRDVMVSRMFHLYCNPRVTTIFDRVPEMRSILVKFQSDRWFFREHPDQLLAHEETVRDSARDWSQSLKADRATIESHPQLAVYSIRYEDLHQDFERNLAALCAFLEIDAPFSVPDDLRPGHDAENPEQLNRKGHVGDWRNYMTLDAKRWINQEAGDELIAAGYVNNLQW